ncbi:hypothetical protein RCZ04_05270 [Capnocytophaga sp. HP1101]
MSCLLATSVITAQEHSKETIKKSKYTIDSIVFAEKETLKKKLSAVNQLLKEKKISEELSQQMKEELTATTEKNIKEKTATEAEHLAKLIREQATSTSTGTESNTLTTTGKSEAYKRAMEELENIFQKKEEKKVNTNRALDEIGLYMAIGFHNLNSSNGFGDNRFKPLGSKSFEIGFTSGFRLLKTNNLLHINYGIAWMHDGLKFKDSEYFVRENEVTKSVAYTANNLNKSKLRTNYLIVPIDFEFDFTSPKTKNGVTTYPVHDSFRVGFGGYVGVSIGNSQKIRYDDGSIHKNVLRNDLNISPWIYGLSAHLGYKNYAIYARYNLTPLFRNNPVNEYPFSIGIRIGD